MPMRIGERLAEPIDAMGDENQVDVIGHEAIGPDLGACMPGGSSKKAAIEPAVGGREEDTFSPVALGDVMGNAGSDDARLAGHVPR